ncbi:uncharacterized protein LOC132730645 [Ruditapes philippinarum]|uniref:uncharacterized protein LOC132730645 n=1 Tax=Ruditapes philippinarum TaxID=129788 RepID=UPI00295A6CCC|nr:uncharacterized protein LOC132730645 [Ruditapes philippinarum]
MASIGSREVQENIVGPLMDMMGQLSTEMRKNLTQEVSSIGRKVDALSEKVDNLILMVEKNTGNNMFVSERPALKYQTLPPTYRRENERFYSRNDGNNYMYSPDNNSHDKEIDRNERVSDESRVPKRKTQHKETEMKYPANQEQSDFSTRNDTEDETNESVRKGSKDPILNEGYNSTENTLPYNQSSEEQELSPYLKTNGYTDEIAKEDEAKSPEASDDEFDEESNLQTDLKIKSVQNSNDKANTDVIQTHKNTEAEIILNDERECGNGINSMETNSPAQSFSGRMEGRTKHRSFNFGMKEAPMRPKSPIPTSATKVNVPYANFKKSKTEFCQDNRTMYLKDALNITENGTDHSTSSTKDTVEVDPVINKKVVQSAIVNEPAKVAKTVSKNNAALPGSNTADGRGSGLVTASNNHQLPASGFNNEHGDDDNRFNAAAHEDMLPMVRRACDLSNLKLVKNGPRHSGARGDDTSRRDIPRKSGADAKEKTSRQELTQSGPELVPDEVLYSLIEKERLSANECSDMKSTGIDTVICLDTSSSMAGKPLTTAIDCIGKILDGFETNAIYHNLEENVAIVTFGNENRIRHHLTNDYGLIREGLDDIKAGGPSPLWLGLALSLAEIKERGGACIMEPMSVLPRIILITDGYASRKNLLNGDDNGAVDEQVIGEMFSLMNTCPSFTSYLECIIPGKCHEEFLKGLTNGRMYTADNTESITDFFKIQEKANTIIKQVNSAEMDRAKIDEAIENSKLNDKGKEDLRLIISASLPANDQQPAKKDETSKVGQETPTATDKSEHVPITDRDGQPDSVPPESIDMSDDVKSPSFGSAVVSNPEWIGHATRQNFTGTVVGPRRKGLLKVLWSDGSIERCKFGINGQYDVLMSKDQSIDSSELKIGSIVVRGKDWRWKDQDGGEGNVGVVTKIDGPVVHVIWSHGGLGNYRYGYNKKFDLTLCTSRSGMHFAWYISEAEDGEQWKRLPKTVNDSIEEMYKSKHTGTFLVKMDTQSLRISIQNLQARDTNTQTAYNLERREISNEEWLAVNNEQ